MLAVFQFFYAFAANNLFFKFAKIVRAFAKYTGRLIFLKYDLIRVNINLYGVPLCNVKSTAEFNRKYDSS